jgi:hypothetical protein
VAPHRVLLHGNKVDSDRTTLESDSSGRHGPVYNCPTRKLGSLGYKPSCIVKKRDKSEVYGRKEDCTTLTHKGKGERIVSSG